MKESHLRIFNWMFMSSKPADFPAPPTMCSCFYFVVLAPASGECFWEWRSWEAQQVGTCGCEHPAHLHPATQRHTGREGSLQVCTCFAVTYCSLFSPCFSSYLVFSFFFLQNIFLYLSWSAPRDACHSAFITSPKSSSFSPDLIIFLNFT